MLSHLKNVATDTVACQPTAIEPAGVVDEVQPSELSQQEHQPDLIERGLAFAKALRARSRPDLGKPADKDFIDSLYDRD